MNAIPSLLLSKLHLLLHRAFVEARGLALQRNHQQLFDLADAFELIPSLMGRWEEGHLETIRNVLTGYQAKYPGSAFDYLALLSMDAEAFQEVYSPAAGAGLHWG
jgi:hypothetical protein